MVALRKSIHYVYDPATQRHTETWTGTSYANAVTDIQYGYNDLGELASVTVLKENGQTPAAVQSSTQYNAAGGKSTTTLPNTVYTYDAGGRLTSTFNSATGITTSYTYKPNTNDISQETVSASSGASVATYSYSYRADGLKTGETDTAYNSDGTVNDTRTLSWQYDGLDRVTQETSSDTAGTAALNYTDSYQYDLNSNRTTETIENGSGTVTDTITSTYNANGELTQAVDANTGTTVYTYDNNGSQIETQHTPSGGTSPDTTTTNEYDLQGQMAGTQTTNSTGTTKATYEYDDSGNPDNNLTSLEIGTGLLEETTVTGTNSPVTTYYLVETQNPNGYPQPIEQAATPGSPQITYVWGKTLISQTYATGATIPGVGTATSPTTYYILTDAHGSTRLITNATGGVIGNMNYDAFGNALGFNASTALTSYLYSSMSFDPASNNYYDDARFYTPGTCLFDQRDYGYSGSLADPMTDLPYTFTGGDPVNMLDLNGHDFSIASALAVVSISATLLLTAGAPSSYVLSGPGLGGPDITANPLRIEDYVVRAYDGFSPARQRAFAATFLENPTANWDITSLAAKIVSMPGDTGLLADGRKTVTVDGAVYRQQDVNYFLYGVWSRVIGEPESFVASLIIGYRAVFWSGVGINGREAWFQAGYSGDLSEATYAAIPGATPSAQTFNQPLHFFVGVSPNWITGSE